MKNPELYWNGKHPLQPITYEGRPVPRKSKRVDWDVRHFLWNKDVLLEDTVADIFSAINAPLEEIPLGERVHRIQQYVVRSLQYVGDDKVQGVPEFWLFPTETMTLGRGDCEDGAILTASLALCAGVPAWRVRVAAGWVKPSPTAPQGGHGYFCFCREEDDQWVVADWCFYPDENVPVAQKPLLKERDDYLDTWFSFNHLHAWSHSNFDMAGRAKDNKEGDGE